MDLMKVATFRVMDRWTQFLFARLAQPAPPNFRRISLEQVLRTDRAAFLRMSELCTSLKADSSGKLPFDLHFPAMPSDPAVIFHLLPLPGASAPNKPKNPPNAPKVTTTTATMATAANATKGGATTGDGTGNGKGKSTKRKSEEAEVLPRELAGLSTANSEGKRYCWPYNMKKGCKAKDCKKGVHACMRCGGDHPAHGCPQKKE
jgi:hypothetical protein